MPFLLALSTESNLNAVSSVSGEGYFDVSSLGSNPAQFKLSTTYGFSGVSKRETFALGFSSVSVQPALAHL
jgi:hypothetical protein